MAETINILGTGGIIEGNLGSANVNVNLDSVLEFDGVNDKITVSDHSSLDIVGDITLSAWVKITMGESDFKTIISKAPTLSNQKSPWQLRLDDSDKVEFVTGDGTNQQRQSSTNSIKEGWNHIAVTVDENGASSVCKYFINGVLDRTISSGWVDYSGFTNNDDLLIGVLGTGYFHDGYLADVRIYNAVVSDADVAILASRINGDPSLTTAGTTNLQGWWKLNNNSVTDSSPNSNDGTASGPTERFDQFHVDVYDNSTTTDGTFTVTQGKVEGLALSSVELNGSDDFININNALSVWTESAQKTFAAWVYNDANANEARIFNTGYQDSGNATGFALGLTASTANKPFYFLRDTSAGALKVEFGDVHTVDTWMHYAIVQDGANDQAFVYQNGVLQATVSSVGEIDATTSTSAKIGKHWASGENSGYFNGQIRDVRLYDYNLSHERVASLYSGTYPQTPLHHWKLDEGYTSGTTANTAGAFEDSGTGTDYDAQGSGLVNASCVNGTLDLDGSLTIAANGTLSAPRGNLTISANILANGNYIHNNGTFAPDLSGVTLDASSTQVLSFYDLDPAARFICSKSINVENELGGASQIRCNGATSSGGLTITMGTTSSAGNIAVGFFANWSDNCTTRIVAADTSGINRWTMQSSVNLQLGISVGEFWEFANGDIQISTLQTTGDYSNDSTITLTGDMEFDAVTVSSGDTLDLNGQRAELSGVLSVPSGGILDADGLLFASNIDMDASTPTNITSCDAVLTGSGTVDNENTAGLFNTLMFNGTGKFQPNNGHMLSATNVIICNEVDCNDVAQTGPVNITVPTGGTLDGDSATLTVAGDFTTSGGLLGASCAEFNGSSESAATSSTTTWGFGDAFSIEFWFKTSFNGSSNVLDFAESSGNDNRIQVLQSASEMAFKVYNSSGSSYQLGTTAFAINPDDGKWHHLAYTNSGSEQKIYYDGRLAGTSSHTIDRDSDPSMKLTVGMHASLGSHYSGFMEELRFFSDVRTVGEIRTNMFKSGYANLTLEDGSTASFAGLVAAYDFDEGNSTTAKSLEDSSPTTARNLILSGDGIWAGAGAFTPGTSTLVMSGTDKNLTFHSGGLTLRNWTVSGTVDFNSLGSQGSILMEDNLTVSGDLDSGSTSPFIRFGNNFVSNSGVLSLGGNVSGVYMFRFDHTSGTIDIPNTNTPRIKLNGSGGTCQATSIITVTSELEVNSGATFNANGNTIAVKAMDLNSGGTLDLRNSTMNFSLTTDGDNIDLASGATLLTGNTTLTGNTSSQTSAIIPSAGNFEVVGDVSHLFMLSGSDLTVIGSVSNNTFQDSTANIRQFHHTLDTQQLLDADEAGDDDLRLEKPALDNAVELQTG